MRFNLQGNLGNLVLSQNSRMVVEICCILINMAGKYALLRLVSPTFDYLLMANFRVHLNFTVKTSCASSDTWTPR